MCDCKTCSCYTGYWYAHGSATAGVATDKCVCVSLPVADSGFPRGEGRDANRLFAQFFQILHENEEILAERGAHIPCAPLDLPTMFASPREARKGNVYSQLVRKVQEGPPPPPPPRQSQMRFTPGQEE